MLSRRWLLSSSWLLIHAGQSRHVNTSLACLLGCTALGLAMPGCRGSYPLARAVHVTQDPSMELPDFDGPPQRLATAKPRVGSEMPGRVSDAGSDADTARHVSAVGHIDDSSTATRTISSATTKTMQYAADTTQQRPAKSPVAPNGTLVREGNTQVESIGKTIKSSSRSDSAQNDRAMLPADANEMLDAFKNSPPEVRQQALRQLIAAASRTADTTNQPAGIDGLLNASLAHAANLPATEKSAAEKSPVRIAYPTEEETNQGAQLALSHRTQDSSPDHAAVRTASHVSDSSYSIDDANSGRSEMMRISDSDVHVESISDLVTDQPKSPTISSIHHSSEPRSPAGKLAEAQSTHPTPTTTKPESAIGLDKTSAFDVASMSESQLYEELLARLSKSTGNESAADRSRRLVMMRHLMVLSGRVDDAVSRIDGMAEGEQEYLRHQLLGLWTIIDPNGHPVPGRRFSAALPQFREATTQLAAATDSLDLRSLAFCTEIESYGQFKKFPSTRFKAGQQVILYCEIENFVAAKVANGYETNLQGSYDVFNEAGVKVASQLLPADRQVSNNYLRDYFIAYQMFLPKDLSPGKYRMQLTLEDLTGKKYGQSTISFELTR